MRLMDEFDLVLPSRKIRDSGLGFEGAVCVTTESMQESQEMQRIW